MRSAVTSPRLVALCTGAAAVFAEGEVRSTPGQWTALFAAGSPYGGGPEGYNVSYTFAPCALSGASVWPEPSSTQICWQSRLEWFVPCFRLYSGQSFDAFFLVALSCSVTSRMTLRAMCNE